MSLLFLCDVVSTQQIEANVNIRGLLLNRNA